MLDMRTIRALGLVGLFALAQGCGDDSTSAAGGGGQNTGGAGAAGGGGAAAPFAAEVTSISISQHSSSEHEPQLVVTTTGRVVASFNAFNADANNLYHLEYAVSDDRGSTWGPVVSIPLPADNNIGSNTSLALDADGETVHFVYATEEVDSGGTRSAQRVWFTSLEPSSSTFAPAVELTDPADLVGVYDQPSIVVTSSGTLLVAWGQAPPDLLSIVPVMMRSQDRGATWTKEAPTFADPPAAMNLLHPCRAEGSDRIYYLYFDDTMGPALWRSAGDDPFMEDARVALAEPGEKVSNMVDTNCVARGDEVWALYGRRDHPGSGGSVVPRLSQIRLAHSSDGGATIDWRADVADPTVGPHYLLPRIALDPAGAIHLSYYEGEDDDDANASYRHARSDDGGRTFAPSDEVFAPLLYSRRRDDERWLGDYMDLEADSSFVYGVFADDSGPQSHISFFRAALK